MPIHIPSNTAGKVWRIDTYKPDRRPAYACATEGELKSGPYGTSFTTLIDGSNRHPATRVVITGPATAKKKAAALEQLKRQLLDAGLVASVEPVA